VTKDDIVNGWYQGMPALRTMRETFIGSTGSIFLPRFENDIYDEPEGLVELVVEALELAGSVGARVVSLTGLVPSATEYGEAVAEAIEGREDLPLITTGHATTASTVALSAKGILEQSGRSMESERVGFIGLGSVGISSLELILRVLPHPAEIKLCDLYLKRPFLEETSRRLREEAGYAGGIEILEARTGYVPEGIYESTLMVGATNVSDIVEVEALRPGTLMVDDSAPHCFDSDAMMRRVEERGDILVTEGGFVTMPEKARHTIYRPEIIEKALAGQNFDRQLHADQITGCVLSAILNAMDGSLPRTIGKVDVETSLSHYRRLEELGFEPVEIHCLGQKISREVRGRFAERYSKVD
jgi:predicted amino acid dehydrogenase